MYFNSYRFLVFFAVVYFLYLASRRSLRLQNALLLVASYIFYAAWDWRFLALLIASTVIDYWAAIRIDSSQTLTGKRRWLALSMSFNLAMLAVFKYYDFGIESMVGLLNYFGFTPHFSTLQLILPAGISFYTFQTMSYTIDVYRGKYPAERSLPMLALFVAYFPQLVAGPIERASHLIPQLRRKRTITRLDLSEGSQMIVLGYFKKVVLADSIAPMVNEVFDQPSAYSGIVLIIAAMGFAVQIYGDFAGYSLIARGLARWMGTELMSNFHFPYLAVSPRDFWRRWHISFSTWLQEYLYIPLGGSRHGRLRTYFNLMVTMILGGLWHGAAWHFVYWGVYQGLLLVGCHLLEVKRGDGTSPHPVKTFLAITGTFILTLIGWVLFRCKTNSQLVDFATQVGFNLGWDNQAIYYGVPVLASLLFIQILHLWQSNAKTEFVLLQLPLPLSVGAFTFLIASIVAVGFRPVPFIYFQF